MYNIPKMISALAANVASENAITVNYPKQVDYSEAMTYASENNKIVELAQITSQEFTLQQASLDREMQQASNLELGMETLDTKLQTSRLDFIQQMTEEQNRHVEKMARLNTGHQSQSASSSGDFPLPESVD